MNPTVRQLPLRPTLYPYARPRLLERLAVEILSHPATVMRVGRYSFIWPHHIHVDAYRYLRGEAVASAFHSLPVSAPKTSPAFGCEDYLAQLHVARRGGHAFNVPHHIHADTYEYPRPRLLVRS